MPRFVPFALAALLATSAFAQTPQFSDPANLGGERISPRTGRELPIDSGTLGLEQLLRKLNTRASILNIVAHPDDEDGGMLTLYARGFGARVADLSLTRGEGGQNAMTGDFEDALGLLRTQELLANDRYTGVTQMFGTEVDFGFSKTKSEAFTKWTHERVLYDAVRAIRIYRPLVITATFIGNPTDGHGQHQVSGEIAQEAFVAAGDPNVFPELTKEGILPWKPLKMYARVPRGAISGKGLFDYATNQNVPAEFTNYITHETSKTPPTSDVVVHEGQPDPLLTTAAANKSDIPKSLANSTEPMSYVQFARIGLSLQKSQIGPNERTAGTGAYDVHYHLYESKVDGSKAPTVRPIPARGAAPRTGPQKAQRAESPTYKSSGEPDFFTGIDTSIKSLADLAPHMPMSFRAGINDLDGSINRIALAFGTTNSIESSLGQEVLPGYLATTLMQTKALLDGFTHVNMPPEEKENVVHELRIKQTQLNDALALSLGVSLRAANHERISTDHPRDTAPDGDDQNLMPGETRFIVTSLTHAPDPKLKELDVEILLNGKTLCKPCAAAIDSAQESKTLSVSTRENRITVPSDAEITRPYFSRNSIEQPVYELRRASLRNAPQTPSPLTVQSTLEYNDVPFTVSAVVRGSDMQDASQQAVSIVPSTNTQFATRAQVVPLTESSFALSLESRGAASPTHGLEVLANNKPLQITGGFNAWNTTFRGSIPQHSTTAFDVKATNTATKKTAEGYREVGYGDLPRTNIFEPATVHIVPVDLKLPSKRRIAYLPGTGDAIPEALASIRLPVTTLTVADLTSAKLASFDTVILGVRTYNAHPDLHGAPTQALLDFARNGGNVVVQYQTGEFTAADAPYPLDLGSDEKVVDETAPVSLLNTQDPLLTTPNIITPADFNNWIEERGHGFMSTWDAHYTALTETHDPGSPSEQVAPQLPQRGGLLTCTVGKGRWTYVAFALYRQLPEAVPGAYRLFLNLLDNPR